RLAGARAASAAFCRPHTVARRMLRTPTTSTGGTTMNIIRRPAPTAALSPAAHEWDPFRVMRDLMRWDPFHEMAPVAGADLGPATFFPDVDVKETADAYVFHADLPGIKDKDLEISFNGNRLTL